MARLTRIKTNGELQVLDNVEFERTPVWTEILGKIASQVRRGARSVSLEANSSFSGSSNYIPVFYRGPSSTRVPRKRKYRFVSCVKA